MLNEPAFEPTQMWWITLSASPPWVREPAGANIFVESFSPGTREPQTLQNQVCQSVPGPGRSHPARSRQFRCASARRISPRVFVPTSISIRVAHPTPTMSIVFIAGVLGLAPTPVRIPVASDAHTMLAVQIATFVNARNESGSRRARVMRARVTASQCSRYCGRQKRDMYSAAHARLHCSHSFNC